MTGGFLTESAPCGRKEQRFVASRGRHALCAPSHAVSAGAISGMLPRRASPDSHSIAHMFALCNTSGKICLPKIRTNVLTILCKVTREHLPHHRRWELRETESPLIKPYGFIVPPLTRGARGRRKSLAPTLPGAGTDAAPRGGDWGIINDSC